MSSSTAAGSSTTTSPSSSTVARSTTSSTVITTTTPITSTTTSASSTITTTSSSVITTTSPVTTQQSSTSVSSVTSASGVTSVSSAVSTAVSTGSTTVTTTNSVGSTVTSTGLTTSASTSVGGSTTYVYTTITESNGSTKTSAVALANRSSTNTGAIVGGAVGGAAGLAILAALLWFFCFKRKRNDKDFDDMMFDPARGTRHAVPGTTDLVDNGAPVEPYTYGSPTQGGAPQMSQYNSGLAPALPPHPTHVGEGLGFGAAGIGAGAAAAGIAGSSRSDGSQDGRGGEGGAGGMRRGPSSASTLTSAGFAGRGANNQYYGTSSPMPMQSPYDGYTSTPGVGSSSSGAGAAALGAMTPSTAVSRKQREAQQDRMRATNADGAGAAEGGYPYRSGAGSQPLSPGGTTTASGARSDEAESEVMVHQDGGRVELPPTYDTVPRE